MEKLGNFLKETLNSLNLKLNKRENGKKIFLIEQNERTSERRRVRRVPETRLINITQKIK